MLPVHTNPYIQDISTLWTGAGIRLFMKREDVIHPGISGNKWRKLDRNLSEARNLGAKTLVTFGGAYSNHIYATAAAAHACGMESAGIIRGESAAASNATLSFARDCGMELIFVSREEYRDKKALQDRFASRFANPYFLPEGGTNCLALRGCREIMDQPMKEMDVVVVPVGTGGTMAGIIAAASGHQQVLGISALKGDFLGGEVRQLLSECHLAPGTSWRVDNQGHCGGYARINPELIEFIRSFREDCGILLDPVYTGKMMFRLKQLTDRGEFPRGTKVCAIHTGGLQGWAGVYERYGISAP